MENEFSDEDEEGSEEYEVGECASAFTLLENEYKNVLGKMQENGELMEYSEAYTKLFEAFFQTHVSERDLETKRIELEKKIEDHLEEIGILSTSVMENSDTITDLTEKLHKACHLADLANAREQKGQEIIESMRSQILKLNTELELKSKMGGDDDDAGNKTKEGFEREKQRLIDDMVTLKRKLTNALSYSEELEHKNSQADLRTNELNGLLEVQTGETSKKQRMVEKLETDIATLDAEIDNLNQSSINANATIESNNKCIRQLEIQLKDQKIATERAKKNGEMIQVKLEKALLEYDTINFEHITLKEKYVDINKLFKLKIDEYTHMKSELTKITKQRDAYEKKYTILEHLKVNIEQDRDKVRNTLHLVEREMIATKKQAEADQKQIENLLKEKEVLHKNIMRIQNTVDGHVKLIKIQEQIKRKLEVAINNYVADIDYQKKMLSKLEKERNKAIEESLDLTQQVEDSMNEIKLKQQNIYDLKKIIAESETKLRQLQNLFEAVRADRNAFQKQWQDATSEVNELKSKYKVSIHQNGQLKEDISVKEALLLKEENILKKLNKDKENLKVEVQTGLNNIKGLKNDIDELKQTEKTLLKYIQEHEATIRKQSKELEQIMNDRDVIGAQLVRRNDEIGLLYEKIKILEITLNRGEAQYDQRIEDTRLLKLEIKRLRQEKDFLSKSIANMIDLKHEVFTLERELAQERLKCRALEVELQQPMNIHRWRKLEGSDPELLELLQKIQILQKRLLNQTTEAIDREKQLKETEKLYFNLRQMLARQPGPDVKNELLRTQRALAMRGSKMKCLVSELNMYETQSVEYKMDLEKVTKELLEVKKKYYKQKKHNERHLATETETKLPAIKNYKEDQTKYAGGGFKMA